LFFRIKHQIPEFAGMFQKWLNVFEKKKEVRLTEFLSVLQAFYDVEYLFTVENVLFHHKSKIRCNECVEKNLVCLAAKSCSIL
jgi:hypothetical protein